MLMTNKEYKERVGKIFKGIQTTDTMEKNPDVDTTSIEELRKKLRMAVRARRIAERNNIENSGG